jgi:hypothetical protein
MQEQGPQNKRVLPITLHNPSGDLETHISLYRPSTKEGDPRLWISKLTAFCNASDLLAVWVDESRTLHALNFSSTETVSALENSSSEFYKRIQATSLQSSKSIADELLEKLKAICNQGFVETLRTGDTGVGFTLETLLGIQANSSKNPDYKGIELKTKRLSANTRSNLFSQVPDWKSSACKNALEILNRVGYVDPVRKRLALYVTVSAKPNAQGIYFEVDNDQTNLQTFANKPGGNKEPINFWDLDLLKERLLHKHAETFWISVKKKIVDGKEHFHYTAVTHTKSPISEYFGALIESNVITMDYTIHLKTNGKTRDHGYLFKILPENLELLFPPPVFYDLSD